MLRFFEVGKRFGARWAPVRYSLSVDPGELVWLSGPPGAGKSALVRIALGVDLPTSGSVEVNGLNPSKMSRADRQAARRRISAVTDDEPVVRMEVLDWVALGLWCQGTAWKKSRLAARDALEEYGIVELVHRQFEELTRGQRFLAGLGRALLRKPEMLLIDWAGAFTDPLPGPLLNALQSYIGSSGAGLVIGEPNENVSVLGGRRERIDLEKGGA